MSKQDAITHDAVGRQFRQRAGLPERTSDAPHDPANPSELTRRVEPEGGLGGHGEVEVEETETPSDKLPTKKAAAKKPEKKDA